MVPNGKPNCCEARMTMACSVSDDALSRGVDLVVGRMCSHGLSLTKSSLCRPPEEDLDRDGRVKTLGRRVHKVVENFGKVAGRYLSEWSPFERR